MRLHFIVLALFIQLPLLTSGAERPADYFQQEVKYDIQVTLDDSTHFLHAYMELEYTNNSPDTLDYLWFHIWPNAYKNDSTAFARQEFRRGLTKFHFSEDDARGYIDSLDFSSDGLPLNWEYHPDWIDVAKIYLHQPLPPGGSVIIETPFRVKIPKAFGRMRRVGRHYEISQWYPKPAVYDRDGWHQMPYLELGEFYSEFGSFDVRITLPQDYVIMATGDLPENDPEYAFLDSIALITSEYYELTTEDGEPDKKARKAWRKEINEREFQKPGEGLKKTVHFHQERVHDFAWFTDQSYLVKKGALVVDDSTRTITLWSLFIPKYIDSWEKSIEWLHDATYWTGKWFGTYPYNHCSAVSGTGMAGYAMEYPNITVIAIEAPEWMLEETFQHEIGHNWFYGIFGFNERDYTWLDEGLTPYSTLKYWQAKYGEEGQFPELPKFMKGMIHKPYTAQSFRQMLTNIALASHDEIAVNGDFTTGSLNSYAIIIQYKTPLLFNYLERYLGTARIDSIWADFAATWSFAHISPEDFRSFLETAAGEDLSWFFDDMIGSIRRFDYGVSSVKSIGDSVNITVTNYGTMNAPVEVATLDKDGTVLESRWVSGFAGTATITFNGDAVKSATIDPGQYAVDADRTNDQLPLLRLADSFLQKPVLRLLFSAPEPGRSQMFFTPLIWGTGYSGPLLGGLYYGGMMPGIKNRLNGALFYSPKQKTFAGSGKFTIRRYGILGTDQLTTAVRYSNYPDWTLAEISSKVIVRAPTTSSPALEIEGSIGQQDITPGAMDPLLWDSGAFQNYSLRGRYWDHQSSALFEWDVSIKLESYSWDDNFYCKKLDGSLITTELIGEYRYAYPKDITLRIWAGHHLTDNLDQVPDQYRFWLSGGLDRNFTNPLVFNRTGDGTLATYRRQYVAGTGPDLKGLNNELPGTTALSANLEIESFLPFDLLVDMAATNSDPDEAWRFYYDTALSMQVGPITLILPLWQNWDSVHRAAYKDWRISLRLPTVGLF
jgi:hypothetical protein